MTWRRMIPPCLTRFTRCSPSFMFTFQWRFSGTPSSPARTIRIVHASKGGQHIVRHSPILGLGLTTEPSRLLQRDQALQQLSHHPVQYLNVNQRGSLTHLAGEPVPIARTAYLEQGRTRASHSARGVHAGSWIPCPNTTVTILSI